MYTSGRTVKSTVRKTTTVAAATTAVRKLVNRHLPGLTGVSIDSSLTADPATLAAQVRTVVMFPPGTDIGALAEAILDLPGLVRADTDGYLTYTIIRAA